MAPTKTHPDFSIFIPTYNRAHTLARTLKSIQDSTYNNLEVIIIDDGSQDNTIDLVKTWQVTAPFPITYAWQENQGKHAAHNHALKLARGKLFITLDSDDSLLPDALKQLWKYWENIPQESREKFAGVAGICLDEEGRLSGDPYPKDFMDSNYLDIFRHYRMNGERREALRVEVLRKYPYPRFPGERHMRPTLILRRMAHEYMIRFTNTPVQINRHAPDGISANRFNYRFRNPQGFTLYYQEEITLHREHHLPKQLFRLHIQYLRFALHARIPIDEQKCHCWKRHWWYMALPKATSLYILDILKAKIRGIRR
ncbi:glycosyltransferase family 2 protein [Ectothiorhodospira shaposhnikovii]|uniref:glycosyltransferase family 2 protein n=1 Tax=Ectothiorhodospira shaposhnikovii TaxID=1054 RepID=UPI0039A3C2BD